MWRVLRPVSGLGGVGCVVLLAGGFGPVLGLLGIIILGLVAVGGVRLVDTLLRGVLRPVSGVGRLFLCVPLGGG